MALTKERKAELIAKFKKFKRHRFPEVQVALLTDKINTLTEHLRTHPKDHHSRRGLILCVGKRRRLLDFLKSKSLDSYLKLIQELGIRK